MDYSTKKDYLVVFCYSDDKVKKTEATAIIKNFGKENGVTGIVADKKVPVEEDQQVIVTVPGYEKVSLKYKESEETFFCVGFSKEPKGEKAAEGVFIVEEKNYLAIFFKLKDKEGSVEFV